MRTASLTMPLFLWAGLVACGAAPARQADSPEAAPLPSDHPSELADESEAASDVESSESRPRPGGPEDILAEYFEFAESIDAAGTPGTREYLERCRNTLSRDEDEGAFVECTGMIARNRDGEFVVIDIDADFRGRPEHVRAHVYRDGEEHELLSGPFSGQTLNRLAALARRGRWGTMDNMLSHTSRETFSLVDVTPFVRLRGMPDDSGLWLQRGVDMDDPVYSLFLAKTDGTTQLLGTREGVLGSSGDWACGEGLCTHDELRERERLCVLPVLIRRASHRDGVLVLQGFVAKTGHRDFPAFHWFVPYPNPD